MTVFKKRYTDHNGKICESRKWIVQFRDQNRIVRRIPAFTDERASEAFGRRLDELVSMRLARMEPSAALGEWCFGLPKDLLEQLASWGMIDSRRIGAATKLSEHIADWQKALAAKGNSPEHVRIRTSRVKWVFEACGFVYLQDIRAEAVEAHLDELRVGEKKLSASTSNFYLQALTSFCNWMVKRGRAVSSPLLSLSPLKRSAVVKDPRHQRRALTIKELMTLISVTSNEPTRHGMSGVERALLYQVAAETGLRLSELASLTCRSFHLDSVPPMLLVNAANTKNADTARLPMKAATAAQVKAHIKDKLPTTKAFNMPIKWNVATMFRADLKAAGIPYKDEQNLYADFHALRATFCTNLAASGVHPKVAQDLARHSDINLTMGYYTHTLLEQRGEAVAKLPNIQFIEKKGEKAAQTASGH